MNLQAQNKEQALAAQKAQGMNQVNAQNLQQYQAKAALVGQSISGQNSQQALSQAQLA